MFNSRLPVSTSVRRPTHNPAGSTSTLAPNRPSGGLSVSRKHTYELFTPQTKTPRAHTASTASKSYRASVATEKKYRKPLPEREEQHEMLDKLINFLRERDAMFPPPDPKKFFSSVSSTESIRIFEFLIARLMPDFKINRLETDVPEALAELDYPYIRSVTKSSLVSVASRTSAAALLIIFDWLVDRVVEVESDPLSYLEDKSDEKHLYTIRFLRSNHAGLEELFDELHPTHNIEQLARDLEDAEERYEKLFIELDEKQQLKEELATLDEDISSCENYMAQMNQYLEVKKNELDEVRQEELRFNLQLEDEQKRFEHIQLSIDNRTGNFEDVLRIQGRLKEFESQLRSLEKQIEEERSKIDAERNITSQNTHKLKTLQETLLRLLSESREEIIELDYPDSMQLGEKQLALESLMSRLEALRPEELIGNDTVLRDLKLAREKLRATESTLFYGLKTILDDFKIRVDELEQEIRHFRDEKFKNIEETIERTKRENETERLQRDDTSTKMNYRLTDADRQCSAMMEEFEISRAQLAKIIKNEQELLKAEEKFYNERSQLDIQLLQDVLKGNQQRTRILVETAERDAPRWEEAHQISETNKQNIKRYNKLLQRRFCT